MAGAAFAGGAFVSLELQGSGEMGNELDKINADMRQFQKIARNAMNAFDVDVSVDALGNFELAGKDAAQVVDIIADKLKKLDGIQRNTSATIKDVTADVRAEADAKKLQAEIDRDAAAQAQRASQARARAAIEEAEATKRREALIKKAQDEANQRNMRRIENELSARQEAEREKVKKQKESIDKFQKTLKAQSKWNEEVAKKQKAQADAQVKAEKRKQEAARKAYLARRKFAIDLLKRQVSLTVQTGKSVAALGRLQKVAVQFRTIGTLFNAFKNLVSFVSDTADRMDKIGKSAQKLGTSAKFMGTLQFAAEQTGANMEQLQSGMKAMQRNIGGLSMGTGEAVKAFEALGLTFDDIKDMTSEEQFTFLSDKLAGVADETQRAYLATRIFGEGGQELANMLANGGDGLTVYQEKMEALGIEVGENQVDSAAKFKDALNVMQKMFDVVKSKIIDVLAPALEELAYFFSSLMQTTMEFDEANKSMSDSIDIVGIALTGVKVTMYALVGLWYTATAVWHTLSAGLQGGQYAIVQGFGMVNNAVEGFVKGLNKALSYFGYAEIDLSFFEAMRDEVQRVSDEIAVGVEASAKKAEEEGAKALKFFSAAMAEATGGESEIKKKVDEKQEEIVKVMAKKPKEIPKVELKLEPEAAKAMTSLADFSSSTSYGIEGLKKAQKNSEDKQIAILKKIAQNTKDAKPAVGVP